MVLNKTIFCFTSDVDWAETYCIEDLIELFGKYDIVPTIFATHNDPALKKFSEQYPDKIGLHPNFYFHSNLFKDGTSSDFIDRIKKGSFIYGEYAGKVIDDLMKFYPTAKTFRSHSFYDNSVIQQEFKKRGFDYDSNANYFLQPNLMPLRIGYPGITRFPVFWEDDSHWDFTGGDWDLSNYLEAFLTPGLKIINVHPSNTYVNVPDNAYYGKFKSMMPYKSKADMDKIIHKGKGTRTFFIELLEFIKTQGIKAYSMKELYEEFSEIEEKKSIHKDKEGRTTEHSDDEYKKYFSMSGEEKQEFVKLSYEKRNAKDKYATSQDFYIHELEINAIEKFLNEKGKVLDIGCGNGYTLISLAKKFTDWSFTGVDFSSNLVEGAKFLSSELNNKPEFICSDAIGYIKEANEDSYGYIITERFIQNLPDITWQKNVIKDIYRVLRKGGRFMMCEGSVDGFRALNNLRVKVGLDAIPETYTGNVSAVRIEDKEFEEFMQKELGFKLVNKSGFSDYFMISRVFHPLMVSPASPRFNSKINEIAKLIQDKTTYKPGIGTNTLWVFEK